MLSENSTITRFRYVLPFTPGSLSFQEIWTQTKKCLWCWEPDRRSNFFFSPPAHLCAVSCMTEISLIVTLNNLLTSPLSSAAVISSTIEDKASKRYRRYHMVVLGLDFVLVCCGCDTSYIVSVHIQCQVYPAVRATFTVLRNLFIFKDTWWTSLSLSTRGTKVV